VPRQFYSPEGNKFGFQNSVYIDPDDLPSTQDVNLISRAFVTGNIHLLNGPAQRNLSFELSVTSSNNPDFTYHLNRDIVMLKGQSVIGYGVYGLRREIGANEYQVNLRCTNCGGQAANRVQMYASPLSPLANHQGIDFEVSQGLLTPTVPIWFWLLED